MKEYKFKVGDIVRWKAPHENSVYEVLGINEETYQLRLALCLEVTAKPWEGKESVERLEANCRVISKLEKALK